MCVEDPQDFLIFLGLEEIRITKWATRKRSFSQNQQPRGHKKEKNKGQRNSHSHYLFYWKMSYGYSNLNLIGKVLGILWV